ncbi:VapA/VapB family virulence-associated protein [Xenorhabdus bharatensis]|uniref:VapA/VapB family virulence-associated protein n=1 Tax=Xenorhabdus bharatensis TaxID=3136256 RepID=UPI0030F3E916
MNNQLIMQHRLEVIKYFRERLEDKSNKEIINQIEENLLNSSLKYYTGTATMKSSIIYTELKIEIETGNKFNGDAFGVISFGGGIYYGAVFTEDLDTLLKEVDSFAIVSTSFGMVISFFNSSYYQVGYFEAIGVGTTVGGAAGPGSWS